jgi:hypothetical protein
MFSLVTKKRISTSHTCQKTDYNSLESFHELVLSS